MSRAVAGPLNSGPCPDSPRAAAAAASGHAAQAAPPRAPVAGRAGTRRLLEPGPDFCYVARP